jgi:hypothetical protein
MEDPLQAHEHRAEGSNTSICENTHFLILDLAFFLSPLLETLKFL